ncbi:TSC22 domain family protein 4-like isoform X2 [Mya arenaria]|uniref:TSC22 domain family protein 4-like isoform X2 n=1 Tax=Mya arenaria TaxID=6604 RepID=UPI0022E3E18F|nr:TSC22 domain family protein 4-like isoform X2 [Mya arenaria]
MADRPQNAQMTVPPDNQDLKMTLNRDELDQRASSSSPKTTVDGVPRKKGAFKIMSVISRPSDMLVDGDSMDDLDESHTELTEYDSSELLDISRATETGPETPSAVDDIPINNQSRDVKEKSDMHSRFRVVKIETKEPFKRGRWHCHDFLDPQSSTANPTAGVSDTKLNDDANSGSSSAGSSIHYTPGVDDPAKNPLLAGATGTIHSQIPEGQIAGNDTFQPIHPAPHTAAVSQSGITSNPSNQVSLGFGSDAASGQHPSTLCQSHSHQSISSVASVTDNIPGNLVTSGQHSSKMKNVEGSSAGMFMPHYSSGPLYPPGTNPSSQLITDNSQQNIGQGQTSTFQTYVHLGQQIPNPSISQSGHSETLPSSEISSTIPRSTNDNMPAGLSTSIVRAGTEQLTEELNKDLNAIQDSVALSPALVAAVGDLQSPTEEDKSGSSTVAIDNKIEQAMDLVKSHLMFAVREEVEVLKEQIAELIERNNQLEYENGILRAAASTETLAKLAQPRQQPPSSSS